MDDLDGNASRVDFASYVKDSNWAFSVCCSYHPSCEDACMLVLDINVWYLDSGASKHITS